MNESQKLELNRYFEDIKSIQSEILDLFQEEDINNQKIFDITNKILNESINERKHKIKSLLHFLSRIADNYQPTKILITIIQRFLLNLKIYMINNFSEEEIYIIFKKNKKILLFLFKNQFIFPNEMIACIIKSDKFVKMNFPQFFYQEFQFYYDEELLNKIGIPTKNYDSFDSLREIGENESYVCELIRNDNLNEFINYINSNEVLDEINPSIYEANLFLIDKKPNFTEYSAFFGSVNIFKYLLIMKYEITSSVWIYAIHGQNYNIIHLIEENHINPPNDSYEEIFIESLKCHHNEIAEYIKNNYLQNNTNYTNKLLKYFNFNMLSSEFYLDSNYLFDFCHYDYFIPFQILSEIKNFDVNYINEKTLLCIAVKKGNYDIIKSLLSHQNLKINKQSILFYEINKFIEKSALIYSIEKGYCQILQLLINHPNVNVNLKSIEYKDGFEITYTPLIAAIDQNNIEAFKILLNSPNINVNLKSKSYKRVGNYEEKNELTPLHHAILNKNVEIVKILLNHPKINIYEKTYQFKYDYKAYYLLVEIAILLVYFICLMLALISKNPKFVLYGLYGIIIMHIISKYLFFLNGISNSKNLLKFICNHFLFNFRLNYFYNFISKLFYLISFQFFFCNKISKSFLFHHRISKEMFYKIQNIFF